MSPAGTACLGAGTCRGARAIDSRAVALRLVSELTLAFPLMPAAKGPLPFVAVSAAPDVYTLVGRQGGR